MRTDQRFLEPFLLVTIRDIEQGKDVKLSNLQAVAALGLELELIEVVT